MTAIARNGVESEREKVERETMGISLIVLIVFSLGGGWEGLFFSDFTYSPTMTGTLPAKTIGGRVIVIADDDWG